ncbi:MAG TPA: response regulator [Mobilitalea sp.]|nr:response regulator [Mobilitalea sp.]
MIRLIIVEDEKVIRKGIEKHIPWEDMGVNEVRAAENAEEAFKICREFSPDIIISDIKMPGLSGIELCQKFRESLPDSQIIFISGYSDKEYLKAAISLGAISYVEKPINISELSEAIHKAVISVQRLRRQNTNVLQTLLTPHPSDKDNVINAVELSERGKILTNESIFCVLGLTVNNENVYLMFPVAL